MHAFICVSCVHSCVTFVCNFQSVFRNIYQSHWNHTHTYSHKHSHQIKMWFECVQEWSRSIADIIKLWYKQGLIDSITQWHVMSCRGHRDLPHTLYSTYWLHSSVHTRIIVKQCNVMGKVTHKVIILGKNMASFDEQWHIT